MYSMAKITMQDVARECGVSISTVSRVIRNRQSVDPNIRAKVRKAIRSLGYVGGYNERRTTDDPVSIALVVPNVANPFYGTLIAGIERATRTRGYALILRDSEESFEVETRNLEFIRRTHAKGVIFVSCSVEPSAVLEELVRERFPVVLLDRIPKIEGANIVTGDNVEGAYQAVKYLLRLGHRRIAYITGTRSSSTEHDRFVGYRKALESEDVPFDEGLVVNGEYNLERAYEAISTLCGESLCFTAIFSTNDLMAFGAKQALEDHGFRVPEDVSIVGYDDINFAHTIALTVVSQPVLDMARSATTLLFDLIEGRHEEPQRIVHRPSLVIRNSCQRPSIGESPDQVHIHSQSIAH